MNRKNDKFNILEDAGENITERLSNSYQAMSREEKKRVFAMSERKLSDMKKSKNVTNAVGNPIKSRQVNGDVGKIEIIGRSPLYKAAITATACAAALAVIVGAAFFAKDFNRTNIDSDTSSAADLYAQVNASSETGVASRKDREPTTENESTAVSEKSEPEQSVSETTDSEPTASIKTESSRTESASSEAARSAADSSAASVAEPKNEDVTDNVNSESTASESSSDEEQTGGSDAEMTEILTDLMKENFYCMRNIFEMNCLPTEDTGEPLDYSDESSLVRKVVSDRFSDYASLDDYVHSVYVDSYADYLMSYEYNGHKRYIDKDGELYCDLYTDGGKGYYADTENFEIEINSYEVDELNPERTFCLFAVKTTTVIPGPNNEEEPYYIMAVAVNENGKWRLEALYS